MGSGDREMKEEIRSWDRVASRLPKKGYGDPATQKFLSHSFPIPVRVVAWPQSAPKQEDVPQAGEWVRRKSSAPLGATFIVATGIPYLYQNGEWQLRVTVAGGYTQAMAVKHMEIVPEPEPEPKLYTEAQALEAFEGATATQEDMFVSRLRKTQ